VTSSGWETTPTVNDRLRFGAESGALRTDTDCDDVAVSRPDGGMAVSEYFKRNGTVKSSGYRFVRRSRIRRICEQSDYGSCTRL